MEYTESQKRVIAQVDEFCATHITEEQVKQWVAFGGVPHSFNEDLSKTDLWKYVLPSALGGVPNGHLERTALIECFMRNAGATLPLLSDTMAMAFLSTMRDKSQKEILDELLTRNRFAFSIAFTESTSGSASGPVATTVSWSGTEAHLDGEKTFVSSGQFMPEVLVLANDPIFGANDGGLSLWLVPVDAPGVRAFPIEAVGQEMLCPAVVSFENVKLNLDWQIQTEGKLDAMLKRMFELGRLHVCASSLGLAEAALEDAVDYASPSHGQRAPACFGSRNPAEGRRYGGARPRDAHVRLRRGSRDERWRRHALGSGPHEARSAGQSGRGRFGGYANFRRARVHRRLARRPHLARLPRQPNRPGHR